MIDRLPLEIQVELLLLAPSSGLRAVNKRFFVLYNDLYYRKIVASFGEPTIAVIARTAKWLRAYIKTLDVIRKVPREILSHELGLEDRKMVGNNMDDLAVTYIKDSWKYVYSLLRNRRLFAEYADYRIDEPTNYVFNHYVEINRTYLLSYCKKLWLAPGTYNLNLGLLIKHGNGLGTTKFEVIHPVDQENSNNTKVYESQSFYPPTNINEILPKQQFCLLKLGEFTIPKSTTRHNLHNKLIPVEIVMEEIGLYLKLGFRIFFIDIAQHSSLFNDYDLLFYSVHELDYRYFINIPLKNFYKALLLAQGQGHDDYGSGDTEKEDIYEPELSIVLSNGESQITDLLIEYGEFYFNNKFGRRYFKFNTVYQRRQFVNRFGDFELDWNHEDGNRESIVSRPRACHYDPQGLKWKMPIMGEL